MSTSLVISDSVVHLSISGSDEFFSQHPFSSLRSTAHGRTIQESDRHNPFHIISSQLITLLISFLSNVPLVTHSLDIYSCFISLSRWPWSQPLHRNNIRKSLARNPPRFESSRLHDLIHHTLPSVRHLVDSVMPRSGIDVPVVFSIGSCTRHSTPAPKLIPIWLISFHILSLVNPFVPMSAMFYSFGTRFVTNFFSSMACCTTVISPRCGGIFQRPAVAPCHDSQQSHSEVQVFSSSLQLRDKCVSSRDLSLHLILERRTLTRLTTRPLTFCVTDHPSSQWAPCINAPAVVDSRVATSPAQSASVQQSISVMDCLGTDNSSQPRDVQPSTSPLVSTTAVRAHHLSLNTTSILSSAMYCNSPEPDM